jgi:hypothetical protein
MNEAKWERWAAATGIVFFVLVAVSVLIVPEAPPKADDPIAKITAYFTEHRKALLVSGYLSGLALAFGLWFLGSLRSFLRAAEGGTGRLSAVAFGAGLLSGAMALAATSVVSAAAFRVAGTQGSEAVMRAMFDLFSMASAMLWFPIAVWAAATGVVIWRTGALPQWFAQISLLAALAFLVAATSLYVDSGFLAAGGVYQFIAFVAFGLWVLVTSILLVQRVGKGPEMAPAPATSPPPM